MNEWLEKEKGKRKIDIKEETRNQRDYQSKERERIREICSHKTLFDQL